MLNIGTMYTLAGRYMEALPYLQDAFELRDSGLGRNHADTALAAWWLSINLSNLGRHKKANEFYLIVFDIKKTLYGLMMNVLSKPWLTWVFHIWIFLNTLRLRLCF